MKKAHVLGFLVLSLAFGCASSVPSKANRTIASSQVDRFEPDWNQWVAENASPINEKEMGPILKTIGNASVVGFGESGHGLHDIPEFRNVLFQTLVKNKNFRAITLESGVLEAQIAERYVQGDPNVTLEEALKNGITHGMGLCEESRDLLVWMKNYNQKQKDTSKKLHFFGFDLPVVGDAPILPLQDLSPYLKSIDSKYHAKNFPQLLSLSEKAFSVTKNFRIKLRQYMQSKYPDMDVSTVEIDPDDLDAYGTIGFEQLTPAEQKELEIGINDLIAHMKTLKGKKDHAWNTHLAEIAAQHVRNLRSRQKFHKVFKYNFAVEMLKKTGLAEGLNIDSSYDADMTNIKDILAVLKGRETRELMAAENVFWAQKVYGKSLVYAHTGHLLKTAVDVHVGDIEVGTEGGVGQGMFMADHYKKDYVVITGEVGTMTDLQGNPEESEGGIPWEPVLTCNGCVGKAFEMSADKAPLLYSDLTTVPGKAGAWLSADRTIRWQAGFQGVSVQKGMDAFLYFRTNKPMFKIKL